MYFILYVTILTASKKIENNFWDYFLPQSM